MSKAVLMSIHPEWCELIASGRKTIEVRKTYPKEKTPFKVYIYSTLGKSVITFLWKEDGKIFTSPSADVVKDKPAAYQINCKVIGEFLCDAIISHCEMANADIAEQQGLIKREKLFEYANGKELFGWHISDLVIYDQPKELSDFHAPCNSKCDGMCYDGSGCCKVIARPPQSWCYVEEQK